MRFAFNPLTGTLDMVGATTVGLVPYLMSTGETFTVPDGDQALFSTPIVLDGGVLVVEGLLIEVD